MKHLPIAYTTTGVQDMTFSTIYTKRWRWLPSFLLRFKFFRIEYWIATFTKAPPAGENVVITYDIETE